MTRLSSRERRALFVGAAAIGLGFLARFGVIPQLAAWLSLRQQLTQERELFSRDLGLLANRQRVRALRDRLEQSRRQAVTRTFSGATDELVFASMQKLMQQLATDQGISIFQVRPEGKPEDIQGVWSYSTVSEGEAELETILRFSTAIEGSDYLLHIQRFMVGHSDPLSDPGSQNRPLRFTLTVAGFSTSRRQGEEPDQVNQVKLDLPPSTGYLPSGYTGSEAR